MAQKDRSSVDAGPPAEGAQRVHPGPADLHLLQHPGELAGERPSAVPGDLRQRGVEAEPGLDADGQRVEDVGQRPPDALLPALGQVVDDHVRDEEAQRRRDQAHR